MTSTRGSRWRGLKALVHDAVDATTELVKEGHDSAARSVVRVTDHVPAIAEPARRIDHVRRLTTAGVLASVRAINRAVETITDAGMDVVGELRDGPAEDVSADAAEAARVPMRSDATKSWEWVGDAALGVVNGVIGDRLEARGNGLDLGMIFRVGDTLVEPGDPGLRELIGSREPSRIAVFVHGLAATEWSWCLSAEEQLGDATACFGSLLERDLGYLPVYVRYNTGRHVSTNGRALATALEHLVDACDRDGAASSHGVAGVSEIVLVGHSLGGLVIRSACHYGDERDDRWVPLVKRVFALGTPHRGAPLEKIGHLVASVLSAIDVPATRITARALEARSAGIKDLRHGALVDEDWTGRDVDAIDDDEGGAPREVPLLPGVRYHFVTATVTRDPAHPLGHLVGDMMVRVASASGTRRASRGTERASCGTETRERLHFEVETAHHGGVLHHELQSHPAVYEQIRRALTEPDATS